MQQTRQPAFEIPISSCNVVNELLLFARNCIMISCSKNQTDILGINRNVAWFFFCLFVYLTVNLALLPRTGPHWDEILDWQGGATDTYLVAGRWGTFLYRMIMGQGTMPWIAGLLAGIYISTAIVTQAKLLKLTSFSSFALYAGVYMACNQWSSQCLYSFQCDSVALGILLATISVYVIIQWNSRFWAAVLLALSLSSYQTNGIYWFVLWAAVVLMQKSFFKLHFQNFCVVAPLGLLCYFAVQKVCMSVIPIQPETIAYVEWYQKTTSDWTHMPTYPLGLQILGMAHYFKRSVYQALGFGDVFYLAASTAIIPTVILVICYIRSNAKMLKKLMQVMLVLSIWYTPYALTFLMLGFTGDRVCLAAPLSLAVLWLLLLSRFSLSPRVLMVSFVFVFALLTKASYTNCIKARNDALIHERAVRQLHDIYNHARHVALSSDISNVEIVLVFDDALELKAEDSLFPKQLTCSVLDWYTEHYKLRSMRIAKGKELEDIAPAIKDIPYWPDLRSVKVVRDRIVVRIPQVAKQ